MNNFLLWANFAFFPTFAAFAFIDYLGANFFHGLFAAIAYTLFSAIFTLAFTLGYVKWEVEHCRKSVDTRFFTLRARAWLILQYCELVVVSVSLWVWYSRNRPSAANPTDLAFERPVAGYVEWSSVDAIIIALVPYHVHFFGDFETARMMLGSARSESKTD